MPPALCWSAPKALLHNCLPQFSPWPSNRDNQGSIYSDYLSGDVGGLTVLRLWEPQVPQRRLRVMCRLLKSWSQTIGWQPRFWNATEASSPLPSVGTEEKREATQTDMEINFIILDAVNTGGRSLVNGCVFRLDGLFVEDPIAQWSREPNFYESNPWSLISMIFQ